MQAVSNMVREYRETLKLINSLSELINSGSERVRQPPDVTSPSLKSQLVVLLQDHIKKRRALIKRAEDLANELTPLGIVF